MTLRARRLAALLALPAFVGCAADASGPPEDTDYQATGIRVCAGSETTFGIDVSKWQNQIDWKKVAAQGVRFAIVRISDGIYVHDERFAENWAGTKQNGILRGVYQYFRPGQDPTKQAQLLIDALAGDPIGAGDMPAVLDIETTDGVATLLLRQRLHAWLDAVEAGTGRKPMIYTGWGMGNILGAEFSDYPLWTANYTTQCPLVPVGWNDWVIWQYSESGTLDGVKWSHVDFDQFNGGYQDLLDFVGAGGQAGGGGGGAAGSPGGAGAAGSAGASAGAGGTAPGQVWSCADSDQNGVQRWTCGADGNRHECQQGYPVVEACDSGCHDFPPGKDDVCIERVVGWNCTYSNWQGVQYWTCGGKSDLYKCDGTQGLKVDCPGSCQVASLGQDDFCK